MNNTNASQKKKVITSVIYATIVALLVMACAITIAVVNNRNNNRPTGDVGGTDDLPVSAVSYVLPMQNATIVKDYSGAKLQYNDTLKQWEIHKAIDFVPTDNPAVYAIANGTVTNVYTNYLEGTVVEISHDNGLVSIYKSLDSDVLVKVGDAVTAGTQIGTVSTSMAQELNTNAHLHFEMTLNGVKVDPNDYLSLGEK